MQKKLLKIHTSKKWNDTRKNRMNPKFYQQFTEIGSPQIKGEKIYRRI